VPLLAGYTAAIISFPSVTAPEAVFDTALARVEEITLGIVCSAVISRVVFPRHVGSLLLARIESWLDDAGRWASDVLSGSSDLPKALEGRRRLATDTLDMVAFTTHLPYDTSTLRASTVQFRILQERMTALLPILSGVNDRLTAARREGELSPQLPQVLEEVDRWISAREKTLDPTGEHLRQRIAGIEQDLEARSDHAWTWRDILASSLLTQLKALVEVWADCLTLRQSIAAGRSGVPRHLRPLAWRPGEASLHLDSGRAVLSGVSAMLGTMICCAFWIATGWQAGAGAATNAAVFCSLFAFMDNPVPTLKRLFWYYLVSIIFSGIYQVIIFPIIDGFPLLVLSMAAYLLFFGMFIPTPKWGLPSFLLCATLPILATVQARANLDFASFSTGNIASMVGIAVAIAATALIGSSGVEQSIRRLLRANWADLAWLAERPRMINTDRFVRRLVDRFGLMVQRTMLLPTDAPAKPERVLSELRIGINIASLQRLRANLPSQQNRAVATLLQALSLHFRSTPVLGPDARSAKLLPVIDRALASFVDHGDRPSGSIEALRALVGIRCGLLPDAPAFDPAAPPV
jgi:uncharacterized membrane protein YccC